MDLDWALWSFLLTLGSLIATLVFRKRILRALLRAFADALVCDYFDPVEAKDKDGKKIVLMRPNDHFGEVIAKYGPLSAAYAMEWARRNIKVKLPPFELPEGADLKTVGMSAIAQKVLSGKKPKVDDAIPIVIGYVKDWLDKSGILEKIGDAAKKIGGGARAQAPAALTPEAQKIVDKALNP